MAAARHTSNSDPRRSKLAALTVMGLVAASAALLSEMNTRAHAGPAPAALTAGFDTKENA